MNYTNGWQCSARLVHLADIMAVCETMVDKDDIELRVIGDKRGSAETRIRIPRHETINPYNDVL